MEWFDFGDLVRVATVFADSTNTALDPTVVKFQWRAEALGVTSVLTYGADAALGRSAVGHYFVDLDTNQSSGKWTWRFYSTGVGQAAEEDVFYVRPSVASLANQIPAGIDPSTLILPSYAEAGLPTNAVAGQLARVTDGIRGVWFYNGSEWRSLTGHIDVRDFGAKGDGVTDDSAALQAVWDAAEGQRIYPQSGTYMLGSPVIWNTANWHLEGASRTNTIFSALATDISVGGGPNAMFINKANTLNAIIRNVRFSNFAVPFSGWAISAVEGVGGQQAMLSTRFSDCWISMLTSAAGFFTGGLIDSWITNCEFEFNQISWNLNGVISDNHFIGNKCHACIGSFIKSTASNVGQVIGLASFTQGRGTLIDLTDSDGWQLDDIFMEYNGAGQVGALASFVDCDRAVITNFNAQNLAGSMDGIYIEDSQIKIAHGTLNGAVATGATPATIRLKGVLDVDLDDVTLEDDTQNQIGFDTCSGSVRMIGVKARRGRLKIIGMLGAGAKSVSIHVSDSELINGEYGGGTTNTVALVDLATSGNVYLKSNVIGVNDGSSNPVANFRFTGTGKVIADANDIVGAEAMFQSGSTQETRFDSGTYTPTLTNTTNIAASGAYVARWSRSGNVVTVGFGADVDPTAAGACALGISLPIASDFIIVSDCNGTAAAPGIAGQSAGVLADTVNNRATMQWVAVDTTNQAMWGSFTYLIMP